MSSNRAPHAHLPEPDAAAAAHSARVAARVREAVEDAGGAIDFARYMEIVLYAPGLGYYSAGTRKFGEAGDFVTAPEISPLFAGCLARQAAEVLETLPGAEVGEVGAGSGALAAGVLAELERLERLPPRYWILERSATLRERQRAHLAARVPHLLARVAWLDDFPAPGFRGVVLANELLDAFPAHRFRVRGEELRECCVTGDERGFAWTERPPGDAHASRAVDAIRAALPEPLPEGYVLEWAPAREAWIGELAERLARGVVLVLDYGYGRAELYRPERRDGTLACHYRHRVHGDPFLFPGLQDLSVHVDFTALAEAALRGGLEVVGYTTQAQFLLATGLLEACAGSRPGTREHAELTGAIKRLTLPGEMGEAVKVLGLARGHAAPLAGFSGRDLRGRLG